MSIKSEIEALDPEEKAAFMHAVEMLLACFKEDSDCAGVLLVHSAGRVLVRSAGFEAEEVVDLLRHTLAAMEFEATNVAGMTCN